MERSPTARYRRNSWTGWERVGVQRAIPAKLACQGHRVVWASLYRRSCNLGQHRVQFVLKYVLFRLAFRCYESAGDLHENAAGDLSWINRYLGGRYNVHRPSESC